MLDRKPRRRSQQQAETTSLSVQRALFLEKAWHALQSTAVSPVEHKRRGFGVSRCRPRIGDAMIPGVLAPLEQQEELEDALLAFSVHGLGSSTRTLPAASRGARGGEELPQLLQQKEQPRKGWLSSFNTAVVGDRPETVTL